MIIAPSNTVLTRVQAGQLVNNVPFGTWNGTATAASLVNNYGSTPNAARGVNIWRTDWQGRQLLYPTARTNVLFYSLDLGNLYWGTANGTLAVGTIKPDGTNPLYTLTASSGGNRTQTNGTITIVAATRYTYSFIAAPGSASYIGISYQDGVNAAGAIISLPGGVVSVTNASTGGNCSASYIALPGGLFLVSLSVTAGSASTVVGAGVSDGSTYSGAIYPAATSGSMNFGYAQAEVGDIATSRINTTAAPVTLTDYTLSGITVNLAQAPASTAITDATYYAT